jgi:hypothetical protein
MVHSPHTCLAGIEAMGRQCVSPHDGLVNAVKYPPQGLSQQQCHVHFMHSMFDFFPKKLHVALTQPILDAQQAQGIDLESSAGGYALCTLSGFCYHDITDLLLGCYQHMLWLNQERARNRNYGIWGCYQ